MVKNLKMEDHEIYHLKISNEEMKCDRHTILVENYMFGQYRIRLTDLTQPDSYAPEGHGSIVREL